MDSADGGIEHKHSMLFLYSLLLRGNTKGTALGLGGKCCVPRWMTWQIAFITLLYGLVRIMEINLKAQELDKLDNC